jgi:beta-glucanase (GH16 family)
MIRVLIIFIFISCSSGESDSELINPVEQNDLLKSDYIPEDYILVKSDEFDDFDNNNWSKGLTHSTNSSIRMNWNKTTGGENLLNNNYDGYLLDDNVYVNNGLLHLDNQKQSITGTDPVGQFNYSTGWINSLQKINFNGSTKNVYMEIKAKFPKGDKVWPAIWLIDDSENRKWPPEIDVWEYFGKFFKTNRNDEMYMRFIYGLWNDKKDHSFTLNNFQSTYNSSNKFHVFGFNWTENNMKWYIDGELVHTKNKGSDIPNEDWPNKSMCIVMNNGLMRVVDEGNTIFPNSLIIDYLRVYEKK